MTPLHPYFLARDASGQVWRVDPAGQSKVATDGMALLLDQWYLADIGANDEIIDYGVAQAWLDSVPTVVA